MKFKEAYCSSHAAGLTDVGQKRTVNEDGFVIDEQLGLYLVADGMGGHRNGAVASQASLAELLKLIAQLRLKLDLLEPHKKEKMHQETRYLTLKKWVSNSINTTNDLVYQENQREGCRRGAGMGAAIAGLWKPDNSSNTAILFHAGDCRIYLYRQDQFKQLTTDHTLYQLWLNNNRQGEEPPKNIIIKAIGPYPNVVADLSVYHFEDDDIILMCSDGLTNMLSDARISEEIRVHKPLSLKHLCEQLVQQANEAGGIDNITVVASRFGEA